MMSIASLLHATSTTTIVLVCSLVHIVGSLTAPGLDASRHETGIVMDCGDICVTHTTQAAEYVVDAHFDEQLFGDRL